MPKLIEPARWECFVNLLSRGWYPVEAAREAGIDPRTAQRFLDGDVRCSGRRWLESRKTAAAIRREIASQASTPPAGLGRGSQGGKGAPPADPPAPTRGGIGRGVDRPAPIVHHHQERTA